LNQQSKPLKDIAIAIRTALWKVSTQPQALVDALLPSEKLLEDSIVAAPKVLSDEWMLIGRQESTGVGGIIDLLPIAPDGSLVAIGSGPRCQDLALSASGA
jgi:RecB family endonuclease NucS